MARNLLKDFLKKEVQTLENMRNEFEYLTDESIVIRSQYRNNSNGDVTLFLEKIETNNTKSTTNGNTKPNDSEDELEMIDLHSPSNQEQINSSNKLKDASSVKFDNFIVDDEDEYLAQGYTPTLIARNVNKKVEIDNSDAYDKCSQRIPKIAKSEIISSTDENESDPTENESDRLNAIPGEISDENNTSETYYEPPTLPTVLQISSIKKDPSEKVEYTENTNDEVVEFKLDPQHDYNTYTQTSRFE